MTFSTSNATLWLNSLTTAQIRVFTASLASSWSAAWSSIFSLSSRDFAAIAQCPANKRQQIIDGLNSACDDIDNNDPNINPSGVFEDFGIRIVDANPSAALTSSHWVLHIDTTMVTIGIFTYPVVTSCWIEVTKN